MHNVIPMVPVNATEEETWATAEAITIAISKNSPLRESLNITLHNGHHIGKMIRSIKTGFNSPSLAPEIVLHGKWLQKAGFEPNNKLWVLPFSELLIVIPQGLNIKPIKTIRPVRCNSTR